MKDRYTPEPLNRRGNSGLDAQIDERFGVLLQSQNLLGQVAPGAIPFNSVVRPLVTDLPVAPEDGDEIRYLAGSDNGFIWHFRYRASAPSDYRWEFIGGSPISDEVATSETRSANTYGDLSTAGPTITVPFAGDYDVTIEAYMESQSAAGVLAEGHMSYDISGGGASDDDRVRFNAGATQYEGAHVCRTKRKTGLSAGDVLTAKYRGDGTHSMAFVYRRMSVVPIRVGRT